MSGSEPRYNPPHWAKKTIKGSHNCYTYFLDDHIDEVREKCYNICKQNNPKKYSENPDFCNENNKAVNGCGNLKPQPGDYAALHKINGAEK